MPTKKSAHIGIILIGNEVHVFDLLALFHWSSALDDGAAKSNPVKKCVVGFDVVDFGSNGGPNGTEPR